MTVASLWKALDRAGCGRCVGAKELQDHHGFYQKTTPWNFRQMQKQRDLHRPTLAVDLSIWICEALTSTAMLQQHVADPPLQLVYSRTLRLLNLGIKLVVVVEGQRRIRRTREGEDDKFRKRRSGARFWTACERCETMLKDLGVPVVRAKAEGEALCALLNEKGIVDGVISNDGDCFLFGAKVLYTKFTIENLEQSKVMRYDAADIRACLDDDDADKYDSAAEKANDGRNIVRLSRDDLIAFAILTGSDLAGDGLAKIGCRKAIRFIRKCRIDNPLKTDESPAMAELISWGTLAGQGIPSAEKNCNGDDAAQTCGCCGHPGNKRSHMKHGCTACGTEPGEPCFQLSPGGRFRKTLRSKALDMKSNFDPSSTVRLYHQPNENQLPLALVGKTSASLEMQSPQMRKLLQSKVIIRGATLFESRQFLQKTISAYLARTELYNRSKGQHTEDTTIKRSKNSNRPIPKRVTKLVTRGGIPSCEVQWVIKGTMTDAEGKSIDELTFSTIEEERIVQKTYPKLLETYKAEGPEMGCQGDAEQVKRQAFLFSLFGGEASGDLSKNVADATVVAKKLNKPRLGFFGKQFKAKVPPTKIKGRSDDIQILLADHQCKSRKKREERKLAEEKKSAEDAALRKVEIEGFDTKIIEQKVSCSDDIAKMFYAFKQQDAAKRDDDSTIATSTLALDEAENSNERTHDSSSRSETTLTPGHIHYLRFRQSGRKPSVNFDPGNEQIDFRPSKPCELFPEGFDALVNVLPVDSRLRDTKQHKGMAVRSAYHAYMKELDSKDETCCVSHYNTSSQHGASYDACCDHKIIQSAEVNNSKQRRRSSRSQLADTTWRRRNDCRSPFLKKRKNEFNRENSVEDCWPEDVFGAVDSWTENDSDPLAYGSSCVLQRDYYKSTRNPRAVGTKTNRSYFEHELHFNCGTPSCGDFSLVEQSSKFPFDDYNLFYASDNKENRRSRHSNFSSVEQSSEFPFGDYNLFHASDNKGNRRSRHSEKLYNRMSHYEKHDHFRNGSFVVMGHEKLIFEDREPYLDTTGDLFLDDFSLFQNVDLSKPRAPPTPGSRSQQRRDEEEVERRVQEKISLARKNDEFLRLVNEAPLLDSAVDGFHDPDYF